MKQPKLIETQAPPTVNTTLETLLRKFKADEFDQVQLLDSGAEEAPAIVWGRYQGVDSPRVFVLAVVPGTWGQVNADYVQQRMWDKTPPETRQDEYPLFGLVSDGKNEMAFDLGHPSHQIDRLPTLQEIGNYNLMKADPTYRWSMRMYDRLMKGFNAFHEQVYQTVKDRVSNKNDIILEVAKILFLESFRLHHEGRALEFPLEENTYRLDEVFTAEYVRQNKAEAVAKIQAAFDHFKAHPDYVVTDDTGTNHAIFDEQTHLMLRQPRNYETLLELIQELGPVTDNRGQVVKPAGTLADVSADVLGRAFDVFLRANFESKGGLGVYLTPAPVKQAMLAIAFHDIMEQEPGLLTARDADGKPSFRFCDPTCGTYGFGTVAMGFTARALQQIRSLNTIPDVRRDKLFQDMLEHSFVGADSAPMMVTLARVNMALLGAPKAKIFYTLNSLLSDQLKVGGYDLICTNPPFGTPKFNKDQTDAKQNFERNMEVILEKFRSDLKPRPDKKGLAYEPSVSGLAMGAAPDSKGIWKPTSANIDPAVLFIDRCLQMLKPGGRLLIVLPDGVLCNSGDRYVREYIMGKKDEATGQFHGGKAIVKAVISLPSDTFKLAGTGAKTSILYLQKRRAQPDQPERFQDQPQTDVFMGVAETLGYTVKNNTEDYSTGVPNDLAIITGAYRRGE
ncbi:MAG: SAM-dependent methyltransferase [Blastocatellia bacterium]|nr:SAM-dependent methyltransferase [Blastocatellia bacterium]